MIRNILYALLLLLFFACNNMSKKIAQNKFSPTTTSEKEQLKLLNEKVSLEGEGEIPTKWIIFFSQDDTIRFEANDGLKLTLAFHLLKKTNLNGNQIYAGQIKQGNLKIIFSDQNCSLNSKEEVYNKKVNVLFNDKLYEGCGKFLKNKNLDGKWYLEKINKTLINNSEYKKSPFVEINLTENIIKGNDGCNNFNSEIEVQGNRIQFKQIIYTKKNSCSKKTIEELINKNLNNHLTDYYLKEGKLYFYLEDDSLLIFRKNKT